MTDFGENGWFWHILSCLGFHKGQKYRFRLQKGVKTENIFPGYESSYHQVSNALSNVFIRYLEPKIETIEKMWVPYALDPPLKKNSQILNNFLIKVTFCLAEINLVISASNRWNPTEKPKNSPQKSMVFFVKILTFFQKKGVFCLQKSMVFNAKNREKSSKFDFSKLVSVWP